jgi:peroxiredoxin
MLPLGTTAPDFSLPDPAGKVHGLKDFAGSKALLVAFICNHCPFVKHILDGFVEFGYEYAPKGLGVVAISANDVQSFPQDAPAEMAKLAKEKRFSFPYLYDESQKVARAYEAICTPDLYLFDAQRRLVYRGQFDGSRPSSQVPVTGADLRAAADAALAGQAVPLQVPSIGCSIKWKAGNEPNWA